MQTTQDAPAVGFYFTAVLSFMSEQIWFSEMQSSFWKVLSATFCVCVAVGTTTPNLTGFTISWGQNSTSPHKLRVVGRYSYHCSSRTRWMKKKKCILQSWPERNKLKFLCLCICFLFFLQCRTLCTFFHVQLLHVVEHEYRVWKLRLFFILMVEKHHFPNTWEKWRYA